MTELQTPIISEHLPRDDEDQEGGGSKVINYYKRIKKIFKMTGPFKPIDHFGNYKHKKTKKKYVNTYWSFMSLVFNILLVLIRTRPACMTSTSELVINDHVIDEFEKLVNEFDKEHLSYDWIKITYGDNAIYQVVFYNTQRVTEKKVRDALSSYEPKSKHYNGCHCTSCSGGEQFINRIGVILDYPCKINKPNIYYYVDFYVVYKKSTFPIYHYFCLREPNKDHILQKCKELTKSLSALNVHITAQVSYRYFVGMF